MYLEKNMKSKKKTSGKSGEEKKDIGEQTEKNEYDILYVYRPINIFNKIGGIQKITYTDNETTTVGSIAKIYSLTLCCLVITHTVFLIRELYERKIITIVIVIDILANICICISMVISSLLAAFLISPFMIRALKSFKSVDEKLGIRGNEKYTYIRNRIILAQAIVTIASLLHFIYESLIGVSTWSGNLRAIPMHLIDFFAYCQILDFTSVIWIIVTRMKVFNTQLESLIINEREKEKLQNIGEITFSNNINFEIIGDVHVRNRLQASNKLSDKARAENLIRLMKVFDELADITNIVSSSYGLSLLFSSTTTFLYIISTVNGLIMFKILLEEDEHHTIIYIIFWCVPETVYLLISAYSSEKLKNEVERTNAAIDKLSINTEHGSKECELIEDFSQLLSVREVFVTAANFFPYDMTFILSLVGAVATYTVLLMQVKTDKNTTASNSTMINTTYTNTTT